jgi:hypothetical protein
MKKAFVIDNKAVAEKYRSEGYTVTECVKSVQVAQALLLAFILGLESTDVGIFWCNDIDFIGREWFSKIREFSGANFFVSESAEATSVSETF